MYPGNRIVIACQRIFVPVRKILGGKIIRRYVNRHKTTTTTKKNYCRAKMKQFRYSITYLLHKYVRGIYQLEIVPTYQILIQI